MISIIGVIKKDEQSDNVIALHGALLKLGMTIDDDEVREHRAGKSTAKAVKDFQKKLDIKTEGKALVDLVTAAAIELAARRAAADEPPPSSGQRPYLVRGTISDTRGVPVRGAIVRVFDVDLRSREELGSIRSGTRGEYLIYYSRDQFSRAEKANADLIVEVRGGDAAGETVLAQSDVVFNAPPSALIDVVVPNRGVAEYDRIVADVMPLLDGQSVTIDAIDENDVVRDVTFIAAETAIDRGLIFDFAVANRLPSMTKLDPEFWYAVIRTRVLALPIPAPNEPAGIPRMATELLERVPSVSADQVEKGLKRAISESIIAASFSSRFDPWLAAYRQLAVEHATRQLRGNPAVVAKAAGLSSKKHDAFVQACVGGGSRFDVLQRARDSKSFDDAELARIESSLTLNDLTFGDPALLEALAKDVDHPARIRDYAKMSHDEWTRTLDRAGAEVPPYIAGSDDEEKKSNYARLLATRFEKTYPTAAFAGGMQRAIDQKQKTFENAPQILDFIDFHPDFELHTTSVKGYLAKHAARRFQSEAAKADSGFVRDLQASQRVSKISPSSEASATLISDGVHSARQVRRQGKSDFVARYKSRPGFDEKTAGETWERAATTDAMIYAILGDFRSVQTANDVQATSTDAPAIADFPNLVNLFQSGDLCACEECRSIFGPSAYFADILEYLGDRKAKNPAFSARDILFKRRPDLPFIELSCENSNTPLPYIDLACEVLEDQVAPWTLFNLNPAAEASLNAKDVNAIKTAFGAATRPVQLTDPVTIWANATNDVWIIRDPRGTYRVAKTGADLIVSLLRQTRGTAEELAAIPEYVNDAAYTVLAGAKYPLSLPFDLPAEEVRAYLAKVGLKRDEIMAVFHGPNVPNNASELDAASETARITPFDASAPGRPGEAPLIFKQDLTTQHDHWGETTDGAAIAALTHVDVFLDRTGLAYADLQRMLSLPFVNPAGAIIIVSTDGSCDTNKQELRTLDVPALDRIHRFLRLWRKLGWQMWEVDLLIALNGGSIEENNLPLLLARILKLKEKLPALSVEQLCALYADINTTSKFTEAFKKPDPSLYEKLFLNKRITNPIDPAFAVTAVVAGSANIDDHLPPILAATRVRPADLKILRDLQKPSGGAYIDGKLSLGNLSFLYRHALILKALGIKASDWSTLLTVLHIDVFADTKTTLEFLDTLDRIRTSGFSIDQLDYIVGGNRKAKPAAAEKTITNFLIALRKALQGIAAANDPKSVEPAVDPLTNAILGQLQTLGWPQADAQSVIDAITNQLVTTAVAATVSAAFHFPDPIRNAIDIGYTGANHTLRFTGFMTDGEKSTLLTDPSLAAVTGNVDYQNAIQALYDEPRMLISRFVPSFAAPLATLPAAVNFDSLPKLLAAKVAYDTDARELTFFGIMSPDEQQALDALSGDAPYRTAVGALFSMPRTTPVPAGDAWLTAAMLATPLADNIVPNLQAAEKLLADYVRRTLTRQQIVQQLAAALALSPKIAGQILETFQLFGHPILDDFSAPAFIAAGDTIENSGTYANLYTAYYWLHRVALIVNTLTMTADDLDWLIQFHGQTATLDFADLANPITATRISELLDLAGFMRFHHAYSDETISMLVLMKRLIADVSYTNDKFGDDAEALAGWRSADVKKLTDANVIDLAYPAAWQHFSGWRRLTRAMEILQKINAGAAAMLPVARPAVTGDESNAVKQMLRARYDEQAWLDVSKSIQDDLRQRKRDSLVAYLLTRPQPADAPTHKWTNANDLFAYYLIDVEMCSCQLSSRIVQASAAVQLFVQRAFMGLEPDLRVSTDPVGGDDAWLQWSWMKYYRVWEANRRVFAYPENYAEPELRRDKSEIFRNLEGELLQNEVNKDNVETAFLHYVEKLDEVAQLEIAGTWYQENKKTLHVFGRTPGAEPRTYYYRQFIDDARWTAWTKVDCDIKSDYLVPLVTNDRLHLVWPEFREQPQTPDNASMPDQTSSSTPVDKPYKRMSVHLAISEFKSGKWTPKRVSQEPIQSITYQTDDELDLKHYAILPLDFTWIDASLFLLLIYKTDHSFQKLFELAGCRGYPEPYKDAPLYFLPILTKFERDDLLYIKNVEGYPTSEEPGDALIPHNSFVLVQEILGTTPDFFKISYPHYMSYFDQVYFVIMAALVESGKLKSRQVAVKRIYFPITLGTWYSWFYADKLRTFFVRPEVIEWKSKKRYFYDDAANFTRYVIWLILAGQWKDALELWNKFVSEFRFRLLFSPFYHPLTCLFAKQLYSSRGLEALLTRETQFADKGLDFKATYDPQPVVDKKYPKEDVDFDADGSYSIYNWEIFFHAPLMIATQLSKNQRFDDAMRWFHFIFDPTGGHDVDPITHLPATSPQKYWITKPFYLHQDKDYKQQRLENLMNLLAEDPASPPDPDFYQQLLKSVTEWRRNPFDPHLVAQFRTVAYQKMTVMKYIDNLISWGDQRFRMDTLESVNEATQLYVLAAEILGDRPRKVPPAVKPPVETFDELQAKLKGFSNALVEVENLIPPASGSGDGSGDAPSVNLLYFCIPPNDKLLGYWDLVADRLYKIRHCLDIEGVFRQLPLFAPPIDPAALVKAAAAGVDIGTALADLDAPLPYYRFTTILQKANELANDLKALGGALLGALEKKDAEALAGIRQRHEIAVLNAAREVKQKQIDDTQQVIDGLNKNRELVTIRRDYYTSREFMNAGEITAMALNATSLGLHVAGTIADVLAGVMFLIPDFKVGASGFGGSPHVAVEPPTGQKIGHSVSRGANGFYQLATILDKTASIATTVASFQRRAEEWQHQARLAAKELEQIDKQIASATIKQEIARKELENHDLQIENAKAIAAFMHDKYTNEELYQWMIGQISQTYFQTYQLAYDVAKRAEHCYRYEIGVDDSSFIQFGYWDSLHKGLHSGERLQLDLRRLESAWLDQNRRELELTKNISLALINPDALLALKSGGICTVDLPEELFDLDYTGHYFRRIKSVGLTIPCVAGPHTTVSCTLRLLRNSIRVTSSSPSPYERNNEDGVPADDVRFRESHVRVKSIATSTAQNDSGLFELNFRDDRYLPFEGAGAISTWQIELTRERELRQFSYETISDVIMHVRYTAREDAGQLKTEAASHLKNVIKTAEASMRLQRLFDLRHEFPSEWYTMFHPSASAPKPMPFTVRKQHFPAIADDRIIRIESVSLFVKAKTTSDIFARLDPPVTGATITLALPGSDNDERAFHYCEPQSVGNALDESTPWVFTLGKNGAMTQAFTEADVSEAYMVVEFTLQTPP